MKRVILFPVYMILILLLILVAGEITARYFLKIRPDTSFTVDPAGFFQPDSTLGWRNGVGHYSITDNTGDLLFEFNTNESGNRICTTDDTFHNQYRPSIHLYGCSCTFGFSVPDSENMGYKLQKLLPGVRIVNKGVPGYGLAQMFLSLQQTLISGDTPTVAIFNYITSHDVRTPQCIQWSDAITEVLAQGKIKRFQNIVYPYYEIDGDSVRLQSTPFPNLQRSWICTNRSYIAVRFIDCQVMNYFDDKQMPHFHQTSIETALAIMKYCKARGIKAVFAQINTNKSDTASPDIIDTLQAHGFNALDYKVNTYDTLYRCSPTDAHPNAKAHTIIAGNIFDFLNQNQMLGVSK